MKRTLLSSLLVCILLWACGQNKQTQQHPVDPPDIPDGKNVILLVWGAPWCSTCSSELPQLQSELKSRLGEAYKRVEIQLWVPTGTNAYDKPNPQVANQYRQKVGFEKVFVDEWRWQNFQKYLPGVKMMLPGGVLLDKEGATLKKFPPGSTTFVPEDIVAAVVENTK